MIGPDRTHSLPRRPASAAAFGRLFAGVVLLSAMDVAGAQQPPSPPMPQQSSPPYGLPSGEAPANGPAPAIEPQPADRPGFIDALGRLIDGSVSGVKARIDAARDKIGGLGEQAGGAAKGAADAATGVAKGAADVATGVSDAAAGAAKGAADSVVRIPATRMVAGRERCASAPNGAPDCRAAADQLCRSNGLGQGNSLDMQSTEKCPARVYISGRRSENDCMMEYYVTRAMCR